MDNKIVMISIAAVIGIIVLGSVLMPIMNDATATTDTFTNNGVFNAKTIDATSAHTMTYDYTDPTFLTVDDVKIDMSNTPLTYASVSVAFSNDWFLRYILSSNSLILYKCGTNSAAAINTVSPSTETNASLTISEGSATIVMGTSTYNYTIDGAGMIITSDPGDYVVKNSADKAYVNGDSVVYGVGRTERALGTGGTSFNAIISASVDDGITPLYYSPAYVFSENESINYTDNSSHKDLYELTGFTFNLTSQDVDHPITYNQIFVPTEVSAERSVHFTAGQNAIFAAMPVMIILAVLLGVVALVIRSRMD